MPYIQLRTGNTVYISTYEYYFLLSEEEIDLFFQSCEADNLGVYVEDPFSFKISDAKLRLKEEKEEEIPDISEDIDFDEDIEI